MGTFISAILVCGIVLITLFTLVITLLNGTAYLIPVVIVLPTVLIVGIFLTLNHYFVRLQRVLIFLGIAIIAIGITGYVPIRESVQEGIPTVPEETDWMNYEPFNTYGSYKELPQLDAQASLQLEDSLPKLDGAMAFYPLYAAFVESVYPEGEYPSYSEGGLVMMHDTDTAYTRLIGGETDVIFEPAPTDEQQIQAEKAGVELTVTAIGKEGFVFFVNEKNPINRLTTAQVRGIYSNKVTNWRDLGGNNSTILAYQRKRDSRSQQAMKQFMDHHELMKPVTEAEFENSYGHVQQLVEYRNHKQAIGYAYRYTTLELVEQQKLKWLKLDGVSPTNEAIQSGEYPLVQEFYAVTVGTTNPNVQRFVDWIVSEEGQKLVEKSGYVPVVKSEPIQN